MPSNKAWPEMSDSGQGDLLGIKCLELGTGWEEALAEFFHVLSEAGDEANFHPHPLTREAARERARYKGRDLYYILSQGRTILGYGMLRGWDEGYQVPSLGIALHPTKRGTGLAKAFMQELHAAASQRGARRIRIKVHPQNAPAIRLYQTLGYRFEGEEAGQLVGYVDLQDG